MIRTKHDLTIQLAAMRHMIHVLRAGGSATMRRNVAMFYAQRRHVTYDHSPIPCPIWHGSVSQLREGA